MLILVGILSGHLGRNTWTTIAQKTSSLLIVRVWAAKIHCVVLMQGNQTVEVGVKCERLTPKTLVWGSVWGHWELGVETLLARRHLVEGRGRAEGQAATAASSHPSTMNDQGLKHIPRHPRHLERTVFEDLLSAQHQLKLRSLLIMC